MSCNVTAKIQCHSRHILYISNSPGLHLNDKTRHIHTHLLGELISSLNSFHAIIDNSVVTDFCVCTECQWPLVKDKVGSFVSCWSPSSSWSSWNLRSVILWLNLIVLCCFFLRNLSKGPSVTTVEGPLEDSSKHHRQERQSSKYWLS